MKSKTVWTVLLVLGLAVVLLFAGFCITRYSWAGGFGGGGMMRGFGFWNPLGFLGMTLMRLIPLGFLVLVVLGVIALFKGLSRPAPVASPTPARTCSNCGKPAQSDWTTCPHCGKPL